MKSLLPCLLIGVLAAAEAPPPAAAPPPSPLPATGWVIDETENPIPHVEVGCVWDDSNRNPFKVQTGADGSFSIGLTVNGQLVYDPNQSFPLMAKDRERKSGALFILDEAKFDKPIVVPLQPLSTIKGHFDFHATIPLRYNAFVYPMGALHWPIEYLRNEVDFVLQLPPGAYRLKVYGEDIKAAYRDFTVAPEAQEYDLGTIDSGPVSITGYYGKEPPPIHVDAANVVLPTSSLQDFKGKWVLLAFWGYTCGPCVGQAMPRLMKFYDAHAAQRGRFEILALHIAEGVKTMEAYEQKIKPISERLWNGRSLPFPVLVDGTRQTFANYGDPGFPTEYLISPDGILQRVNGDPLDALEAVLAKKD